jgi:tRNA threonylcarbamoyladenosine biosynthesis protein TsaE
MNDSFKTTSIDETMAIANNFGQKLRRGDIVSLFGDLGSGKTQFVKGVGKALQVNSAITSPSFVILNRYEGKDDRQQELMIYHFDLYRVKSVSEIYDLGYEEYLQGDGVCFIEWANELGNLLPTRRYDVHLTLGQNENERYIQIQKIGMK